ncbi:MAG: molybdopterin molybdotransferase MoeA [SAR202 cluster bacterium]|nr:molybdopterin molybdotransferase MoeA [SAR202 cluster bacterium]
MSEFFNVMPSGEAHELLFRSLSVRTRAEKVPTAGASGRVLAKDIYSPEDLPAFARSSMDGFSVRASDTFGASEGMPAYFEVVGEVPMGSGPSVGLAAGQAARAYTGGMLAGGADAVVMVENTQAVDERTIEVNRPVAPGENVIQVGEDVRRGDVVIPAGRVLRPQDIGGLMALGIMEVSVAQKPRVAIVSTGDELVPPAGSPGPGQVRDINTYTISALVEKAGGVPVPIALVPDEYETQRLAAVEGLGRCDMLVFSAGSSVSARDMTARVLGSLGSPGVLVHGLAHKPGKPTIIAVVDGKPAIGLPGNPVSAAVVFGMICRPAIYRLAGCTEPPRAPSLSARLLRDIPSVAGREDHAQVRLVMEGADLCAAPVFGKSNLIYTLVRSDGAVIVPLERGGLYAGETVTVFLHT